MAYRNDVDAMEARLVDLQAEVDDRTRERDEVARLIAETRERDRRELLLADLRAGGPTRRLRRRALITLGLVTVAVLGVLGYRALQRDDRFAVMMEKFEGFADAMCQCHDTSCAQQVSAELGTWSQKISKDWADPPKPDEATMKRMETVGTRFTDCMSKAMSTTPPTP